MKVILLKINSKISKFTMFLNQIIQKIKYHINSHSVTLNRFKSLLGYFSLAIYLFLVPEIAHANPITEGVDWVMDLLTNGIARSAAIIGIAIMGYLAWFGRITGETCGKYIAGIVLVFGGATIVDLIISAVS